MPSSRTEELSLRINGRVRTAVVTRGSRLLDAIRRLGCTGAKEGCGEGECGACTVLMDGKPVNSCVVFARQAVGKDIVTVEGVGQGWADGLHPFQKALVAAGGVQCGFCTPGVVMCGVHLLATRADPDDAAMRTALSGNLCRCTGYAKIFEAVRLAAAEMRGARG